MLKGDGCMRTKPCLRWRAMLLPIVGALGAPCAWTAVPESVACGTPAPTSGTYTMLHGGLTRTYRLSMPSAYDPHRPARLILVFHGWGGDETEFLNDASVLRESSRRGYVLVAPRGIGSGPPDNSNNSWTFRGSDTGDVMQGRKVTPVCDTSITPDYTYPSCKKGRARNTCSWTQCQDEDIEFVKALVEHLKRTLCIDTRHVFAAGGSNGGMFTWELGQNPKTAPMLRAIAPIIGLPHRGDLRPPGRRGGLPVIVTTGVSDPVVPPGNWDDEGYTTTSNGRDRFYYTGATAIVKHWAQAKGCPIAGKERPFNTGYAAADCRSYCAATDHAWPEVLDCRAQMGHDYDLSWSWKLILDFFDRL